MQYLMQFTFANMFVVIIDLAYMLLDDMHFIFDDILRHINTTWFGTVEGTRSMLSFFLS